MAMFLTGERRRLVLLPAGMAATALFCVMPWMTFSPIVALTGYFLFLAFFEITSQGAERHAVGGGRYADRHGDGQCSTRCPMPGWPR
ncbi:MAG: hypothetical protein M9905_02795 [Rhizobiaceae bacterium]|nr:hypothetical protein [Rhizobiaceae bacterium]